MEILQFVGTLLLCFVIVFVVGMSALIVLFKLLFKVDHEEHRPSVSFKELRTMVKNQGLN